MTLTLQLFNNICAIFGIFIIILLFMVAIISIVFDYFNKKTIDNNK